MILFGISNCDTVRKAKKYLESQSLSFEFHDFRKNGLDAETVTHWLNKVDSKSLVNKRSTSWRALDDSQKALLSSDQLSAEAVQILLAQPTLIKRPVLQTDNQVLLGFKEADYIKALA